MPADVECFTLIQPTPREYDRGIQARFPAVARGVRNMRVSSSEAKTMPANAC